MVHHRKIDGKKYELYASANTKVDAEAIKKFMNLRSPKTSVRTVKHPRSFSDFKYGVYIHREK